jgi:hypothetical protein
VTRSQPPPLATWLMSTLLLGKHADAVIGDLIEQHRRGRSSAWYWRQAAAAIVTGVAAAIWFQQLFSLAVVTLGLYLVQIYMFVVRPSWVGALDRLWYPYVIGSRWSWMAVDPWAYRLQLYALTGRLVYCAFLMAVVWMLCRLHPRQRGLLVTLFLATQVGPYLLSPSLFTLVAIPASIIAASRPPAAPATVER